MKISQAVRKVPGGLMVVPLLLEAIVNTFFGNVLWGTFDGTFTTCLQKSGAMSILTVFIFCSATIISSKKAGVAIYKGVVITAIKVGTGIVIGLICGTLFREKGFLGPSTLVVVDVLANSNDGLHAALAGEYGGTADVDAVSILSISNGPFFTMAILGAAGAAKILVSILIDCIVPIIVGCILGSLDEDIRGFCEPGATVLIPFFVFPLGARLNIMNLLKAGGPGILLGVACTLITGLGGYLIYRLLRIEYPEAGGTVGTTAGNAAAIPASVAAVDVTLLMVAVAATAQITAAIIVAAILCPIFISYPRKVEVRKRGR